MPNQHNFSLNVCNLVPLLRCVFAFVVVGFSCYLLRASETEECEASTNSFKMY